MNIDELYADIDAFLVSLTPRLRDALNRAHEEHRIYLRVLGAVALEQTVPPPSFDQVETIHPVPRSLAEAISSSSETADKIVALLDLDSSDSEFVSRVCVQVDWSRHEAYRVAIKFEFEPRSYTELTRKGTS